MTTKQRKEETTRRRNLWGICSSFNRIALSEDTSKQAQKYARFLLVRLSEEGFNFGKDYVQLESGVLMPTKGIQQWKEQASCI